MQTPVTRPTAPQRRQVLDAHGVAGMPRFLPHEHSAANSPWVSDPWRASGPASRGTLDSPRQTPCRLADGGRGRPPSKRTASLLRWLVFFTLLPFGVGAQSVQPPRTVSEAAFRQQWVGPQADRMSDFMLGGTNQVEEVTDWAAKIREGLHYGSLQISPGLGAGWEYSNRTGAGVQTDASDDNSPYVAPSLGLIFDRTYGPLSLNLAYGGGYVYYVNPDYSNQQSGGQRNPLNQTLSMRLGHVGSRHEANVTGSANYGTGQNVQVGGNTTTANFGLGGDYSYNVTEFFTVGSFASFNATLTRYGDSNSSGSDLSSARFGASADWLATGKTTLGFTLEGGWTGQLIQGSDDGDTRQYVQALFTGEQSITSKLTIEAGLGVGYVTSSGTTDVDSQYVGVRPVYQIAVNYTPSEKTFARIYSNFEGAEVAPDFGLQVGWRPRETTSISLSVYQDQNYSYTTLSQVQVNRGFVAGIQQMFFSKITVGLSGGWQQTENVSLSSDQSGGLNNAYAFFTGSLRWDLNDWLYWQTTIWASSGNTQPGVSGSYPETVTSTGLNLIF